MPDQSRRAAILYYNGIGDHLMTLPAMRALAEVFDGKATLACLPGAVDIFGSLPFCRTVHVGPGTACWNGSDLDADRLASLLAPCDLLVCLNRQVTPAIARLLRLLRPSASVGLFPEFTVHIPFDQTRHSADLAFDVARHFAPGLRFDDFSDPLELSSEAADAARRFHSMLPDGARCLAIHADTAEEKMWPREKFRALLNRFLGEHSDFFVALLGLRDLRIRGGAHARRIIRCDGVPLAISLALLRDADLFLGVDSALLHAADLFRIPAVGLFGPSDRRQFGFRFCSHRYVTTDGTLDRLKVEPVLTALNAQWSEASRNVARDNT